MTIQLICVDANFVVKLINSPSKISPYLTLWDKWEQTQTNIIAPTLLCYEVTNVFHRMKLAKQLSYYFSSISEEGVYEILEYSTESAIIIIVPLKSAAATASGVVSTKVIVPAQQLQQVYCIKID